MSDIGSQLTSLKSMKSFSVLGMQQAFTGYDNPKGLPIRD